MILVSQTRGVTGDTFSDSWHLVEEGLFTYLFITLSSKTEVMRFGADDWRGGRWTERYLSTVTFIIGPANKQVQCRPTYLEVGLHSICECTQSTAFSQ